MTIVTETTTLEAWSQANEARRQLMARLLVVEGERDDARREYRRSDVVVCAVQAWLANANASRAELVSRLAALGVVFLVPVEVTGD
jgi:hypothetical protein